MATNESQGGEPVAKYVGYKLARVRWKPQPSGAIQPSEYFVTGSWDDEVNRVAVWHYNPAASPSPASSLVEPQCVCELAVAGDVMDMQFLDEERILVGLSTGSAVLLHYRPSHQSITTSRQWDQLHYINSHQPRPCTAVATSGVTIATGGEDGRINVLHPDSHTPQRMIDKADNAIVTGLVCTLQTELLSTSSSGQLKMWDLRKSRESPARIMVVSGDAHSLQCLDRCPNQPHLVAVGRGNGSVCFWDLRQNKQPVSIFKAHSSDVWELRFHRHHPSHLFTCSQDSSLWHWDASLSPTPPPPSSSSHLTPSHHPHQLLHSSHTSQDSAHSSSPWLSGAVVQGKVDIANLLPSNKLPVNSLDVESRHVVCGTDSEMLFVVPNMTLR